MFTDTTAAMASPGDGQNRPRTPLGAQIRPPGAHDRLAGGVDPGGRLGDGRSCGIGALLLQQETLHMTTQVLVGGEPPLAAPTFPPAADGRALLDKARVHNPILNAIAKRALH